MRIGIDVRLASYGREGGIAQYTLRLLRALAQVDASDTFIMLYHWKDRPKDIVHPRPRNVRARRLFTPPHHRYEQHALPIEVLVQSLDVLHSPDFIPPFRRNCAAVITIHDLAFKLYPHLLTAESAAYYGQVERAAQSAEQIIAVSEATRRDIVRLLAVDEKKITVIHEAADPLFKPLTNEQTIKQVLRHYQLTQPFVLFVGTIEPRKNLPLLLRAFRRLLDQSKMRVQLVLAGKCGWLSDDVFALVDQLHLGEQVKFLGPLPSDELVALYNAARTFVLPSLYEGFGLTVVEAMSCGTPVIVSNVSSLPEVAGEAGLCVSPEDPNEWATAMQRLLEDEALRRALRGKGLRRAGQFSWERAARETLAVYHKAVAR